MKYYFAAIVAFSLWIISCGVIFEIVAISAKAEAVKSADPEVLRFVLEKEKALLGIVNPISFEIDNQIETCRVIKNCEDGLCGYSIKANRKWASRTCIRHELYHIYKDHFADIQIADTGLIHKLFFHFLITIFWYEPMCNFYAIFG